MKLSWPGRWPQLTVINDGEAGISMKLFLMIIFLEIIFHASAWAGDLRRCLLLPVTDNLQGAMSYKIFEDIERYLQEGDWCYYRPNAEILDVLGQYRQNLPAHLENPAVLKIISERTAAGSLIRINAQVIGGQLKLNLAVLGSNGEDLYFQEESTLPSDDLAVAIRTLKNWLEAYKKRIPYDSMVVAVLGDQFTLNAGQEYGMRSGMRAEIFRSIGLDKHPLLQEVVGWQKKKVGEAKILAVSDESAQGQMTLYQDNQRLKVGDWAIMIPEEKVEVISGNEPLPAKDRHQDHFGKLGQILLSMVLGASDGKFNTAINHINFSGFTLGVILESELWATRHWWAGLDYGVMSAKYRHKKGVTPTESLHSTLSRFKAKAGYRYLLLDYYYGPRIDLFMGYTNYWFRLPQAQDGLGMNEVGFRGIAAGVKGDMPFLAKTRLYLRLEALIFATKFVEQNRFYGKADRVSSYELEFGGSYEFMPGWRGEAAVNYTSNAAKFTSVSKVTFGDTLFKLGTSFVF